MFQSSLHIHNTSIIANSLITRKQALLQLSANTVAVNDANTVTSESRRFLSKSKLTPLTFDWGGCLCSDTFQGMWLWRWSSLDIWTNSMNLIKKDRVYWRSELPCIWLPWFPISPSGFIELKIRISGFNCQSAVLSFFLFSLNLQTIALGLADDDGEDEDLKYFISMQKFWSRRTCASVTIASDDDGDEEDLENFILM